MVAQCLCPQPRACPGPPNSQSPGPGTCCHISHPRKAGCGKEPGRIFSMGRAQGNVVGGAAPVLWGLPALPRSWAQAQRGSCPKFHSPAVTAQENLPANPNVMGPCCEKGRRASRRDRRVKKMGGGIWRTSGFLSTSPPMEPTLYSLSCPPISPEQPLTGPPPPIPASGVPFHTSFWVLKSICFIFERMQEFLRHPPQTCHWPGVERPSSVLAHKHTNQPAVTSASTPTPLYLVGPA